MTQHDRDWAVSEHMTFNGSDFVQYTDDRLKDILNNTIRQSTRFGWEFISVMNNSQSSFCLYEDDWTPKRVIGMVDNNWDYWLDQVRMIEEQDRNGQQ